ncbi:MAG: prolipoprotein diacylglyceryl transferase [Planctomycetaceae bacterium]|jgi:phosphatidylglycerol:prolipoprotein diacylglycerol transferase|nr:prolipoprotein diacylglyceryl transferase [Planctomycetaceae bacterium]
MRPTLFYIPPEIFGHPVFGLYGLTNFLLVAVVVIASVWRFVKTKKWDEEIGNYFVILVIIGVILTFVAPKMMEPVGTGERIGFPIRGYGVCLLVAILSSLFLVLRLSKRKQIPSEQIFSLCLWAVLGGILGARAFYITEYWSEMVQYENNQLQLVSTLYNIVNIANGGLVVYGSIFGGILGSLLFMIRNKMPVWATFDAMAPAMMLGLSIGRIGCLLNGCCFGGVTDVAWGIVFPEGSFAHLHQIEHGQTFYCGLKFAEQPIHNTRFLAVEAVQPGSDAEVAGLKPNMLIRGVVGTINGKSLAWDIGTRPILFSNAPNSPNFSLPGCCQRPEPSAKREILEWIAYLQKMSPDEKIRFDIYTDSAGTGTKPYFVTPTPSVVLPVHPTQIYSSVTAMILCLVLLILGRFYFFRCRDGSVFAVFLILYSVARFILENIRTDEDSFLGTGMTISQNVSILVFVAGIILSAFLLLTNTKPAQQLKSD